MRAEEARLRAARLIIVILTVLVGITVVFALAIIVVKSVTVPGYYPKAWPNTLISVGAIVAGLLALRHLDDSWRRTFVLYFLFQFAIHSLGLTLEYKLYVLQLGKTVDLEPSIYMPHLAILAVALVVGFRASWLLVGAATVCIIWLGYLQGDIEGFVPAIVVAMALPFTATLVERLLDEVEKEAKRARYAETSLSVMTHDLGNPLTVLSSSLEMLEEDLPPEQRDTLLRAIRRNTNALRNLLDEFREFPYLDRPVSMHMADFRGLVHDVIELYARPLCKRRGQTLRADLRPVEVVGAPSRLSRMTRELLTNAIKYTPRGGHIKVNLYAAEDWAVLRVSDNGWGISEEEISYVFDQHWRGSGLYGQKVTGTGLGLYICKRIVDGHGGRITVESQEEEGSTFTVRLPLPDAAADQTLGEGNPL